VIAIFCGRLRTGGRPTVYGRGTQTRDYIYVGDVVTGLVAAADADVGGAINLGTEEETSVLRLVELLGHHADDGAFAPHFEAERLGEIERSCLAVGRAREQLGWEAAVPIEEGLTLTYEASAD
jgi:UDP-glucose 4-epimerase